MINMLEGMFKCKKTLFVNEYGEKRAFIIKGRYYLIKEQDIIFTSPDPNKAKDFAAQYEDLQQMLDDDPLKYKYEITGEWYSKRNRMYITACPKFIEKHFYYKFIN